VEIFVGQENFQTVGGKNWLVIVFPPASALPVYLFTAASGLADSFPGPADFQTTRVASTATRVLNC
jgi:hypothetical protein